MATTTNFGWETPDDTDLVKDGALAMRTLGNAIDASLVDLKGGTTGQVLSKASNTDLDYTWVTQDDANAIQNAIVDAKGDLIAATAADTPARLAVGNNGETLVADSSASTGLRWQGNFAAGKNKILNSDFSIWQRGTSFASGISSQYTADRFYVERSSGTYSVSRQTFTPGTAPVAGYEGKFFFRISPTVAGDLRVAQYVEDVQTFAGQTVTFSFWAKASTNTTIQYVLYSQNFGSGGSSTANNTTGASQAITTSWARYSFTVTMDSIAGKTIGTGSYVRFAIDLAETFTGDFDTWGWQLEAGNVATAFQTATGTLAGELAACKYYYQRIAGSATGNGFPPIGTGIYLTSSSFRMAIPLPASMRSAPSVQYSGTATAMASNGGNVTITSLSSTYAAATNVSSVMQDFNTSTTLTSGWAFLIYLANATTNYFEFSAEL